MKIYEHFKLEKKKGKQEKNKEEVEFFTYLYICEKPDDIESVSDINMNFPSLYP